MKELLEFCTPLEAKIVRAVEEHGGKSQAATALGLSRSRVREAVERVQRKAVRRGISPVHGMTHAVPEPMRLKRVSTMRDGEGNIRAQWVIGVLDEDKLQLIRDTVEELSEPLIGLSLKHIPRTTHKNADPDLFNAHPVGDAHVGMFAWGKETGGDNFDLKIAERDIALVSQNLVSRAPNAETGWLLNVGDFFHADNEAAETPRGKNRLDVDGRWKKVLHVGKHIMISYITLMVSKYPKVIVTNVPGNHDPHMAFILSSILDAYFRGDDRVHVDMSPASMFFYRHGSVLLGTMHGHQVKRNPNTLLGVMHEQRLADISECCWKYWHVGHIHHKVVEVTGCIVESHNTLAAKDSYHAQNGYFAQRFAEVITYHKDAGEIGRQRCTLAMVRDTSETIHHVRVL